MAFFSQRSAVADGWPGAAGAPGRAARAVPRARRPVRPEVRAGVGGHVAWSSGGRGRRPFPVALRGIWQGWAGR